MIGVVVVCGHVSGLLVRRAWPLALMKFAIAIKWTGTVIPQQRRLDSQLPRDVLQRPVAARQQRNRLVFELVREMTPRSTHLPPLRSSQGA